MLPEPAIDQLQACKDALQGDSSGRDKARTLEEARRAWQSEWRRRPAEERGGDKMFPFYLKHRSRLPVEWQGRKVSDPWLEIRDWLRDANRADAVGVTVSPRPPTTHEPVDDA